jgi:hypothetical protein
MSVALRGNLRDFGIAEVFQLIGQQRKTGMLDVTRGRETLRLAFDAGRVVWARPVGSSEDAEVGDRMVRCGLITQERLEEIRAESTGSARPILTLAVEAGDIKAEDAAQIGQLITNEAIFVVLRWSEGSFDFSAQGVRHDQPPENLLGAEQILMDGLRMVDEWQTFAALVPDSNTVFERNGPLGIFKQTLSPDARSRLPALEKVFALVDGRLSAQRIIDLSRLGIFDATRALAELHQHNVIVPLSKRQARARLRESSPGLKPVVERVRWLIAAAFPLLLLSGMVSLLAATEPPVEGPAVFAIERAPLEDAREIFEKRRLRNALEARRLLTGEWPEDLRGVEETTRVDAAALTGLHGDAYYYARRGSGIVLLAPER